MSDVKCAGLMYRVAERDILTLRSMTVDAPVESFGFHVQQAAEKALKAWLALLGETYPLTHSIEMLLDLLADRGTAVESFRTLIDYTPYAVEFRSPGPIWCADWATLRTGGPNHAAGYLATSSIR